jgi:predicted GTPase
MSRTRTPAPPSASGNAAPSEPPTYRQNPEVDAKIDAYIKENPKYWAYIQGMPRERLERTLVLNEVRELDRQHRMKEGILKQINKSPALKAAYETLVKDLPEEQREGVIAQLARQAKRAVARSQNQQQTAKEAVGV